MFSWFKKHRLGGHSNIDRESRGGLSASAPDLTEEEDTRQPIQLEKVGLKTERASLQPDRVVGVPQHHSPDVVNLVRNSRVNGCSVKCATGRRVCNYCPAFVPILVQFACERAEYVQ